MSHEKTSGDYEVGYRKPPKATQFKRGISGNPKGHPKKIVDFDTEIAREANSLITVNDNGKRKNISKLQGIAKQLTNKALTETSLPCVCFLLFANQHLRELLCRQHNNPAA